MESISNTNTKYNFLIVFQIQNTKYIKVFVFCKIQILRPTTDCNIPAVIYSDQGCSIECTLKFVLSENKLINLFIGSIVFQSVEALHKFETK